MQPLKLRTFIKSSNIKDLEPVKVGIYNLKRIEKKPFLKDKKYLRFIFTYKIKRTKYTIYSCKLSFKKIKSTNDSGWTRLPETEEGFIEVKKSFKKKRFNFNSLPSALTVSINKNIDKFNNLAKGALAKADKNKKTKRNKTDRDKKFKFLNDLDM